MRKLLIILSIIFPITIKAYCNNQELTRYKTLSSNINTYYDYDELENKFHITVYNISEELKIKNENENQEFQGNAKISEIKINNQNPGTMVKIGIYPTNNDCQDYRIQTIYVSLPYYNKYYKDEMCKNNSNTLCSKWANTSNYTYEQFIEKVKYTKQEETKEEIEPEPEIKNYSFFDFLEEYYIIILILIIISGSVGIYYLDKKNKFDFSLK